MSALDRYLADRQQASRPTGRGAVDLDAPEHTAAQILEARGPAWCRRLAHALWAAADQ